MNLSGLGAVYPGYLDAMKAEGAGRLAQTNADTGEIDAMGRQALGRALFAASMPGASPMPGTPAGGPQPPPPGQASMPAQPPMGAPDPSAGGGMPGQAGIAQPPMPQGMNNGPPGGMPQQAGFQPPMPGQASQPGGMPQLDLQTVISRIQAANPGIKPEVLMSALERAAPILSQQAKQDMMSMKLDLQRQGMAQQGEIAQLRHDARMTAEDRQRDQGDRRLDNQGRAIDARVAAQGGAGRTPAGVAVSRFIKEGEDAGQPRTAAEISQFMADYTRDTNRPSATQIRQENNNKRYDSVITTIDDALADIGKSYKGGTSVTGLVGRGLRLGEVAANIAGWSDSTLANSFLQKIEIIKTQLPGLLAGRSITSRDERARVDRIVAGLSAGDTRQITVEDLQYLQKTLKQLRPGDLPGKPATGPGAGTRAPSPAAASAPPAPPNPGDVVNGYQFLGGNPGEEASWKQVQ